MNIPSSTSSTNSFTSSTNDSSSSGQSLARKKRSAESESTGLQSSTLKQSSSNSKKQYDSLPVFDFKSLSNELEQMPGLKDSSTVTTLPKNPIFKPFAKKAAPTKASLTGASFFSERKDQKYPGNPG
ncbi:MAG: hypothetical protein ACOYK6_05690 [Chthoniobacterales bacterium]